MKIIWFDLQMIDKILTKLSMKFLNKDLYKFAILGK